jgi:NADP-dependent 3-hydroxy acid dehydrogenase YdfG
VTGASSGIGAATARALAADGWRVFCGARRVEKVVALANQIGGIGLYLDVTDQAAVDAFVAQVDGCDVLVNNAGGAKGKTPIADADDAEWRWMFETNVLGTVRVTRALLPKLLAAPSACVIDIVSIASHYPYPGGAGYNAAKFGQRAATEVLRQELAGTPVRVTQIDPGLVETEFSLVRFGGDAAAAAEVYRGVEPLTADDVAEAVRWVAARPAHVNIDSLAILARDQIGPNKVVSKLATTR